MKIYKSLADLPTQLSPAAIALGTFDGLHIGHRQLVEKVITSAKESGGVSVLFTFSNHPRAILFPDHSPKLLMTQERKAQLLADMGLDILVTIPFTEEFFKITPQNFVALLVKSLQPYLIVIGDNYSYGYKGQGNSEMMRQAGQLLGFAVEVFAMVTKDGATVSSTLIRSLLTDGKVQEAMNFLGRPYELQGLVVTGDQRGRLLGFPTANVAVDP
ncbi:MAG: riboflavin kinase, partial [Sporomusaceae bacterium]|nr:riboflavin kinase [Sporomusaceae bacterium]